MSDFLHKNLEALKVADPLLHARLADFKANTDYDVFTDSDPASINIIEKETHTPLYQSRPVDEIMRKIKAFEEYCRYPYLYFFGMGNGIFYNLSLTSNPSLKRILVVEPEMEIIYIALHFSDFSEAITEKRFVIVYAEDTTFARISNLIAYEDAKIYAKLYDLNIYNPYYNKYIEQMTLINKMFTRAIEHQITSVGNDSIDSLIGLKHHIQNIPDMVKSPGSIELVTKLTNTDTAIIVSTGPSLHKQLPLLKEIKDHVTLICIDASFPILEKWGIKPDIVVSLERIELTSQFYKVTPTEFQKDVIFCITSIVHEELKNAITQGPKHISMRPFGYTRYFQMDHWGYFGVGMSAANMAFEIVYHSKFKNLILIGQDLAYGEDGNSHSKGYTLKKDDFKVSNDEVYVEKYGGGGTIRTNNIWQLFLNFFEKDIATSNATSEMKTYNCTEGGARIHGAIEMPFAEAVASLVDRTHIKQQIVLDAPSPDFSTESLKHAEKMVNHIIEYGTEVKTQIESVFIKVATLTEELEKLNESNRLEEVDFEAMQTLLDEIDDIKAYFNEQKFWWLFGDIVQSYIVHQELEIAKIMASHVTEDIYRKAKMIDWVYAHKYWLFSLAGGINAIMDVTRDAAKEWMEVKEVKTEENPS